MERSLIVYTNNSEKYIGKVIQSIMEQLDETKEEDRKLVHDYWTKLNETDEVEGRKCADVDYFN